MIRWQDLIALSEAELNRYDIALVNLVCAVGLPGTEKLDIPFCLDKLDQWAKVLRKEERKLHRRFLRDRSEFSGSWAYARILNMVKVLWKDLGVTYNEAKRPEDVPFEPEDRFLHGILQGNGGTCASLPVLYVSIGRRLGYPLKLADTRGPLDSGHGHLFCRWDEPGGERFNIEVNDTGLSCPPDDHYRTGKYASASIWEDFFGLLKSKSRKQELAMFLCERASEWQHRESYRESLKCFAWAGFSDQVNDMYKMAVQQQLGALMKKIRGMTPPVKPDVRIDFPPRQWPHLMEQMERQIIGAEVYYDVLTTEDPVVRAKLWDPARQVPPGYREKFAIQYPEGRTLRKC